MVPANWPAGVNKKAYGQDSSYDENREEVEYKSGRRIYYRKNSIERQTHAVNLSMDDKKPISGSKTEFRVFLAWFENDIKGGTVPFYFPDVTVRDGQTERLYYMKETPTWSGQGRKEVTFTLEDA